MTAKKTNKRKLSINHAMRAVIEGLEERRLLAVITGPDGFGYVASDFAFESLNLNAGDAGVTTLTFANTDDSSVALDLGTDSFSFYGTSHTGATSLFVNTNGLISFASGLTTGSFFANTNLATSPTQATISPLWDDWQTVTNTVDGKVLAKFEDTDANPGNDRLIIEWNNVEPFGQEGTATFQAILELNTGSAPGKIIYNYVDLQTENAATANGASATVGIKDVGDQSAVGANRLLVSFNALNANIGDSKAILIEVPSVSNQPPIANDDPASTAPSTKVSIDVLGNDSDPENDPLQLSVTVAATNGVATVNDNGTAGDLTDDFIDYTPNTGFHGIDTFTYKVDDGNGNSDTALVTVTVGAGAGVGIDPCDPTKHSLDVVGTTGSDLINIVSVPGNKLDVYINTILQPGGPFTADNIIVFGLGGDDTINNNTNRPSLMFGEAGKDKITGGSNTDLMDGGSEDDDLTGAAGNDILIGGTGADRLVGAAGNDWLVSGTTDFTTIDQLCDVRDTPAMLTAATVHNDSSVDKLTGAAGTDRCFIHTANNPKDTITDKGEIIILI